MISKSAAAALLVLCMISLCSCGGGSGSSDEGIRVTLNALIEPTADGSGIKITQPAGSKTFDNTEGITIRIDVGYLVFWSITLEPDCSDPDFSAVQPWWGWLINSAYAHADSTPLQMGVPNVIDLTGEESQNIELGVLNPPPDSYCGATTQLLSADNDANGLPTTIDMIGRTVYIEGAYSTDGGLNWTPFIIDTGTSLLPARRIFPLSLALSSDQLNGIVNLSIEYQTWLNGVDLTQLSDINQLNQVLFNVTASIKAEAE